jgi:hypothetical protein
VQVETPPPEPPEEPPPEIPQGPSAEDRYQDLLPALEAARQEALDAGADETHPDEYAAALDEEARGRSEAEDGDYEAALASIEQAIARYTEAAESALAEWEARAARAKQAADVEKARAGDEKAFNAAKEEYLDAEQTYQVGRAAQTARDFRGAIPQYETAAGQFAAAAALAADRRAKAAAALLSAEQKVSESDEIAAKVEQELLEEEAYE